MLNSKLYLIFIFLILIFINGCSNSLTGYVAKDKDFYENDIKTLADYIRTYKYKEALATLENIKNEALNLNWPGESLNEIDSLEELLEK